MNRATVIGAGRAAARLAVALGVAAGRPALAQTPDTAPPPAPVAAAVTATQPGVAWGKWAAAALAVGATAVGIHQHNSGNDAWASLVRYCGEQITCTIGADGRYADARAEATYRQVVRDDRSARAWLIGGQVAAVAAAVLFVLDLRHETGPPNIPFAGLLVEPGFRDIRIGARLSVGLFSGR